GPDKVTIQLVVHGPALRAFHAAAANPDTARKLASFVNSDVRLAACGNTMRGQNVTLKDLLPGFSVAERGGVVLIAQLQAQGYVYLRP
ncbi:MAG: DsrE family protein, partial [Croceibacterium sp.]